MGQIADAFNEAFRDFSTTGIPATGAHDPVKAEIRSIGSLIEIILDAISAGFNSYATVAAMNADTSRPSGTIGYVYANNGSASDAANGFYQWNGSAWVAAAWLNSLITNAAGAVYNEKFGILSRAGAVYAYGAPHVDGTTLRWPAFNQRLAGNVYSERAPANGQLWFEVTVPTETFDGTFLVYYDAADNTVKTSTVFTDISALGGDTKPVLAILNSGNLSGINAQATLLKNDFDANASARPTVMGADTKLVRTTSIPALANLGIAFGYGSTDQEAAIGGMFRAPDSQRCFARVFVYDNDSTLGTPIVPAFDHFTAAHLGNPSTGLTFRGAILEKIYSTRLRSYVIQTQARSSGMVGVRASIDTDGRNVILAGLQIAASDAPWAIVPVSQIAAAPLGDKFGQMYFPPELSVFADRPVNLYPTCFIDRRPMVPDLVTLSRYSEGGAKKPLGFSGNSSLPVDPSVITDGEALILARHFDWPARDQVQYRPITARKIAGSDISGMTIDALFLGDSKVDDTATALAAKAVLEAYGATVNLLGTLVDGSGNKHEGRSGRRLTDYVGRDTTYMAYVANPATYIAAPNYVPDPGTPDKYKMNPFLFTGSGTGSYGGRWFDFASYLSSYSSIIGGTPDIVAIDLGTNDYPDWDDLDALTEFVDVACTRMITSIRGTGAKVLFTPAAYGWTSYWFELWTRAGPAFLRGLMRAVGRVNDPLNVRISSAFAQMSPFAYGGYTPSNADADTGLQFGGYSDQTHPKQEVRTQNAVAIAADIAAMMR